MNFFFVMVKILGPCVVFFVENVYLVRLLFHSLNSLFLFFLFFFPSLLLKGGYQLVRNCVSGHIYDSSPLDFTSDLGAQFALHPSILKMPGSLKLVSWVAKGIASGLDALYLTRFEAQRVEYWQALYSSVVSYYLDFQPLKLSLPHFLWLV